MNLKKIIADFAGLNENQLLVSASADRGDFCFPCFSLAKEQKQNPKIIAENLANQYSLKKNDYIEKVEALSGYVNFFLKKEALAEKIIDNVQTEYKLSNIGDGKTVCVEYCSANLAKYLHIGHFSTTIIGESINRIYKALGYNVVRINYLGDYGTPFGKMVVAVQKWSSVNEIKKKGVDKIQSLYVEFSKKEAENTNNTFQINFNFFVKDYSTQYSNSINQIKDYLFQDDEYTLSLNQDEKEDFMEEARKASKMIEDKKGEEYEIYKNIIKIAIDETKDILNKFDITFDDWNGESYYSDKINDKTFDLLNKKIASFSDKTIIIDLSNFNLGTTVLRRSDGGSVYITRDLCAVDDRFEKYHFDEMLYVVAVQQKLHFEQLFKICELENCPFANKLKHVSFGMFSTPEGKIASRKGKQAILKDILQTAEDKAMDVIKDRNFEIENKNVVAKKVARSSLAFSVLKIERNRDKIFDLQKSISFDGETAPYLLYTNARTYSILRKYEKINKNIEIKANEKYKEIYIKHFGIIKTINDFDKKVIEAKEKCEPAIIAKELLNLAQDFNKLYNEIKIIDESDLYTTSKLISLVKAVQNTFKVGLPLVVVDNVQEM